MRRRGKRADRISSAEEAERAVNDWIEPRKLGLIIHSADDLLSLARRIWEDAYAEGRGAASLEAFEAETFGGG